MAIVMNVNREPFTPFNRATDSNIVKHTIAAILSTVASFKPLTPRGYCTFLMM
jgi:hypothetical protein